MRDFTSGRSLYHMPWTTKLVTAWFLVLTLAGCLLTGILASASSGFRAAETAATDLAVERIDGRALFAAAVAEGAAYQDLFSGPAEPAQLGHARVGRAIAERLTERLARAANGAR